MAPYSPPDDIDIESLLIDISAFPEGWVTSDAGAIIPGRAPLGGNPSIRRISLNFYTENGGAGHEIHKYQDITGAAAEFDRQLPIQFFVDEFTSEWEIPDGLEFESPLADRYKVACASFSERIDCQMLAQYNIYVVKFGASITPTLTYEEFGDLLETIDVRMVQFLGNPGK